VPLNFFASTALAKVTPFPLFTRLGVLGTKKLRWKRYNSIAGLRNAANPI